MSQLRTNAILDASGGTTATVNGIPLRPGVLDPENRIINGAFDFWQRGTSNVIGGYNADRWYHNAVGGGTMVNSRQSFSVGDTIGSNSPTYFMRQTVSGQSASTDASQVYQVIEGVRSYAGQTITVLGWARRSSGSGNIALQLVQQFGTGGSPSASVTTAGQQVALTTSWAPFAVTFAVPSIAGKTLGTNGNDGLRLSIWFSAGSSYDAGSGSLGLQTIGVDFWGVHIKQGTHTTSAVDLYRQPELGPELARCQRYYERTVQPIFVNSNYAAGSWQASGNTNIDFKTTKRGFPTVTVAVDSNIDNSNGAGVANASSVSGFIINVGVSNTTYPYARANILYTADSEL